MMHKLFLDTNIVLDFLFTRTPFEKDAEKLFQLRSDGEVEFTVSALTLATCAYYIQKSGRKPSEVINTLLDWFNVIDLNRDIFESTIASGFKDFEDGIQYYSALKVQGVDAIITRNGKDFKASTLPILTPSEFLKSL